MIRVLVVDDHPWFREGLVFELNRAPDIEVIAEAGDGRQALSLGAEHLPDVVVLDLAMPVMDGTTALPGLVETGAKVLVLTLSEEDERSWPPSAPAPPATWSRGSPTDRIPQRCAPWPMGTPCSAPDWQRACSHQGTQASRACPRASAR